MSIQSVYRGMPDYFAAPLAVLVAAVVATALNVAIPVFVCCVSVLFNWHHSTAWRAPTFAFALCAILTRIWFPFQIAFAPVVLGTGAIACLLCCWFFRRKVSAPSEHVIET